jgi:hypothetical protein
MPPGTGPSTARWRAITAQFHPEFTRSGWLLLTYDVNTFVPHATMDDVTIYRPRFLRVRIAP